jgi:hypothetical protein
MSETPRTGAEQKYRLFDDSENLVTEKFARKLETELAEANAKLSALEAQIAEGEFVPLYVVIEICESLLHGNMFLDDAGIQQYAAEAAKKGHK